MSDVSLALNSYRSSNAGFFGTGGGDDAVVAGTNTIGDMYGGGKPTARFALTADQTVNVNDGILWDQVQIDPGITITPAAAPWYWQVAPGVYRVDVSLWTNPVAGSLEIRFGWCSGNDIWSKGATNNSLSFTQVRVAPATGVFGIAVITAPATFFYANRERQCYMTITRLGDL